jgi:hypothetical protein
VGQGTQKQRFVDLLTDDLDEADGKTFDGPLGRVVSV